MQSRREGSEKKQEMTNFETSAVLTPGALPLEGQMSHPFGWTCSRQGSSSRARGYDGLLLIHVVPLELNCGQETKAWGH